MAHPKVLVTGATGKTGSAVVAQLRAKGWPVRALVHARDARSERLERLGAETVVADLFDPRDLIEAMRGTARAYYCPPFDPFMLQSATAFALAAREAKLEFFVSLTQWLANPVHPSLSTRQHWLADQLFSALPGIPHTVVNPGLFADYPYMALLRYAAQLGIFPLPVDGESRNAPPSADDIARVAVAALLRPDLHAGNTYRPTGPESLSVNEIVAILSRVLGHRVRHVKLPMWLFLKAAKLDGNGDMILDGLPYYLAEYGRGTFEYGAPTNHVLEVTGREPEDFETIARRYAALPQARPTRGKRLRAFLEFMLVPFAPGFDPAHYERAHGFPVPGNPAYSIDDERWLVSHDPEFRDLRGTQPLVLRETA